MRQRNDTLSAARTRLEAKQARFTPARRLVIETLHRSSGPQSAADLAAAIDGAIPISSLYRTLAVLEESEVIERFPDQAGIARYELAEWLTGHHHHMTCVECGATSDVAVPGDLEATVADLVLEVGRRFDFAVTGHRLDLQGVCSQCR
jgi:Fe2+ or Zn2+ uptake regulation protein